jgi:alpha-tubulin suppressor-like RCC1 family protein
LDDFTRTNVPSDLTNAIAIATGYSHCLALKPDGTVKVWGSYFDGSNYYPAAAPSDLSNAVAIAAGNYHALALRNDGTVCAWGYNAYGQTNVPPGLTNVVAISAGGYYSLALKKDGTIVGWGSQGWGETNFPPGLSNVTAISAGVFHGLALKADGTVVGWGNNGLSVIVPPPDLTNVVAISGGSSYSAALQENGSVFAWGNGPTNVPANLTTARAVAAGDIHALALPGVLATTQMASASWQGGNFTISLPTLSGRVYMLEYKDSLTDSDWKSFPLVPGNGEILNLTDSGPQAGHRFYRVRQW